MTHEWEQWWNNIVDTEFHSQFSKACSGRFRGKYKVSIRGVPYHLIDAKILIYDGLIYENSKLEFIHVKKKKHFYTKLKNKNNADWIVDYVFNNFSKYTFTDLGTGKTYEHYNDIVSYNFDRFQTLIIEGQVNWYSTDIKNAPRQRLE